ncbi:MAG: hypothetical protein CMJ77_01055 [Planctomycetaceae bacterium]|nr:hypothetical protein [Planctomycetaceae bacterium]
MVFRSLRGSFRPHHHGMTKLALDGEAEFTDRSKSFPSLSPAPFVDHFRSTVSMRPVTKTENRSAIE